MGQHAQLADHWLRQRHEHVRADAAVSAAAAVAAVSATAAPAGTARADRARRRPETLDCIPAAAAVAATPASAAVSAAAAGREEGERAGQAADGDLSGFRGAARAARLACPARRAVGTVGSVHPVAWRLAQGKTDHGRHAARTGPRPAGPSASARCARPAVPRADAAVHRIRGRQHTELVTPGIVGCCRQVPQVLAAEHQQVALHDDAPARLDHQLADVDHVEQVITLIDAQRRVRHSQIPYLACRHLPEQHAQLPGGKRQVHRQPGPVGFPDGPIGEHVRLAPVVHALAEAAPDRDGGMKEDRLPCPPLSRADLAELTSCSSAGTGVRVSVTSPASSRAGSWPSVRARARNAPTSSPVS